MVLDSEIIKNDIKILSAREFYIKYIIKSNNWYFSEYQNTPSDELLDKMDCFKEIISKNFDVSFHSAQIVGSAKLGISLAPKKAFRKFIISANENEKESDIDLAIVSGKLFDEIWNKLREIRNKTAIPRYKALSASIFRGYINDKDFKDIDLIRREWEEKIAKSNIRLQDDLSIVHPISYRIYRNWEDLEDYQLDAIYELKEEMI